MKIEPYSGCRIETAADQAIRIARMLEGEDWVTMSFNGRELQVRPDSHPAEVLEAYWGMPGEVPFRHKRAGMGHRELENP